MSKVNIFFADGLEEIEGLTVVDLLRRAGIDIDIVSISNSLEVTGSHNIKITADKLFNQVDFDEADMIILPGGMPGTINLGEYAPLVEKIVEYNKAGKMLGAICAAPSVLGVNGVLEGKDAVCYPSFEDKLIGANVLECPVVVSGNVITSRGMGTAIDFGLAIIEHYQGKENADNMAESIIYR